jgi:hypothetical protein
MISRELTRVLAERYPTESSAQQYLDHVRVLSGS